MRKICFIVITIFMISYFTACSLSTDIKHTPSDVHQTASQLIGTNPTEVAELSPDKVVEMMFKAAYDADADTFLECWDTGTSTYKLAKSMYDQGYLTSRNDMYLAMGFDAAFDKIEVLSTEIEQSNETTAKVTAEVEAWAGSRSKTGALEFEMTKKDGKWYIAK